MLFVLKIYLSLKYIYKMTGLASLGKSLQKFYWHKAGVISVEFAFIMPILLSFLAFFAEIPNYMRAYYKTMDAAYSLGEIASAQRFLYVPYLKDTFEAVSGMVGSNYNNLTISKGYIASSLACSCDSNPAGICYVTFWEYHYNNGSYTFKGDDVMGTIREDISGNTSYQDGDNVILSHIQVDYQSGIGSMVGFEDISLKRQYEFLPTATKVIIPASHNTFSRQDLTCEGWREEQDNNSNTTEDGAG